MPFSLVFFDENYDTDYTFSQEFLRSNLFVNVQKYDKKVKFDIDIICVILAKSFLS